LVCGFTGGPDRRIEAVCPVGHHETMPIDLYDWSLSWHEDEWST
jgi:hypothetical protein